MAFKGWLEGLKVDKTGLAPRGTIAGALVVIERLKAALEFDIGHHTTAGGGQIRGAGGGALKALLAEFGEIRPYLSEAGQTNRGVLGEIRNLLSRLSQSDLGALSQHPRMAQLREMQLALVEQVRRFHELRRLRFHYDASKTTWSLISDLLAHARENGKDGPVAQYLVGAKLALRFREIAISNESFSTADAQSSRPGDFLVGDTAIHVTVAPMAGVYDRCRRNIGSGLRPLLLVPDRVLAGARQNADLSNGGRIAVESIESFVSLNIEELSMFSAARLGSSLAALLGTYNLRVEATETDKSMLIEIPPNLTPGYAAAGSTARDNLES